MSEAIISVEKLGKKYRIRHPSERRRYSTLRDVIAEKTQGLFQRLKPGRPHSANNGSFAPPRHSNGSSTEDFWALRDVCFEVKQGEVVGIIGRNGAGKSTLLKILSRITEPTTGRVTLRGRIASLLEVGTGFHPELSGRENIFLNGAILGMSRVEMRKKFDEIVAFAEVEKFLDTPVKHYSSGMYVRLAFAVAAHLEPEILIVDEVLAVGDAEFQKKCLGKMHSVSQLGRTVLFVSHQLGTLRDLCTRGILMEAGRATSFGTIEAALCHYLGTQGRFDAVRTQTRHVADVCAGDGSVGQFHLFYGQPLVVRARLKNLPDFPSGFTVAIKDGCGRLLSEFSTNPHDGVVLSASREAEVTFSMDFCPYAPGEYFVDVAVTEPNVRIIEEIAGALKFDVLPARLGGTLAYDSRFGEFFPPHAWKIAG